MSTIVHDGKQPAPGDAVLSRMTAVSRTISTLNPKKLKSSDFIDLSGRRTPYIMLDSIGSCEIHYGWRKRREPFPPNTRGFLYYHLPTNLPQTCGQIRFRVTKSDDPKRFDWGTDLIGVDATPWSISIFSLMCPLYENLRKQILRDRLITRAFIDSMTDLQKKHGVSKTSPREMYYLEQPFMFEMNARITSFRLVTASELRTMKLIDLFADRRKDYRDTQPCPYQGRLLLRFERSTLPEDEDTHTVVLRVLKVLDPIKLRIPTYDAYVPMPEGETLLLRRKFSQLLVRSWDLDDEDNHISSALKILPSEKEITINTNTNPNPDRDRTTLDPRLLKPSDFVDLTGEISHPKFTDSYIFYEGESHATATPFPRDTRGFLYYHHNPSLPPTSGELRFRITSSADPAQFQSGHDLERRIGTPWSVGLLALTHSANSAVMKRLLEDRLLTREVVDAALEARGTFAEPAIARWELLQYLEQPFEIEMSAQVVHVGVRVREKVERFMLRDLFVVRKEGGLMDVKLPYTGTLVVRFERSTLPEHKGRNMVVLRVVKFLKTMELVIPELKGSVPLPVEDSFLDIFIHTREGKVTRRVVAWDLDDSTGSNNLSCLKLLPSVQAIHDDVQAMVFSLLREDS